MLDFTCPRNGPKIQRAEKNYIPDDIVFQTKPQIALDLIDRAKANGIEVVAWTADELYGRDGAFLDGLDERGEAYVVEIPPHGHVWLTKPKAGVRVVTVQNPTLSEVLYRSSRDSGSFRCEFLFDSTKLSCGFFQQCSVNNLD